MDSTFPRKVCSSCWTQTLSFHIFYKTVQNAHENLTINPIAYPSNVDLNELEASIKSDLDNLDDTSLDNFIETEPEIVLKISSKNAKSEIKKSVKKIGLYFLFIYNPNICIRHCNDLSLIVYYFRKDYRHTN